jgi:hypothetical protein
MAPTPSASASELDAVSVWPCVSVPVIVRLPVGDRVRRALEGGRAAKRVGGSGHHTHVLSDEALIGRDGQRFTRCAIQVGPGAVDQFLPAVGDRRRSIGIRDVRERRVERSTFLGGAGNGQCTCCFIVSI